MQTSDDQPPTERRPSTQDALKLRRRRADELRMTNVRNLPTRLAVRVRLESGQTMAEYGILLAVIALVVIVAAVTVGGGTSSALNGAASRV